MSHFTVGVVIPKNHVKERLQDTSETFEQVIENLLGITMSPFYENMPGIPKLAMTMEELQETYEEVVNYEGDNNWSNRCKNKFKDKTLEYFCENYYGYLYKEDGAYSTYNENSKWDWYVIGGRWDGCLPIKDKEKCNNEDEYQYEHNVSDNCCQIKNIELKKEISDIEIKELKKRYEKMIEHGDFYTPEYYKRKYPTFEALLEHEASFYTYALLTSDGEWIEPGEMGWFGCSSATPEKERDFKNIFNEYLSKEDPESYFVLVDCHI